MSSGNQGHSYPLGQEPEWAGDGSEAPFDVPGEASDAELDTPAPEAVAPADADEVVQGQAGFSDIPPGEHELIITGYYGTPDPKYVKAYIKQPNGQTELVGYGTKKRTLKLAMASNPKASMLFDIYEPPADPQGQLAYWHGVPEGKKAQGWHAHTYRLIVDRAIAPWPIGKPCPAPARFPRNWIGRRFVATVEKGDPYTDPKTGREKEGRNRLNQRSFKPAEGQAPMATAPGTGTPGQTQVAVPAAATGSHSAGMPVQAGRPQPPVVTQGQRPKFDM